MVSRSGSLRVPEPVEILQSDRLRILLVVLEWSHTGSHSQTCLSDWSDPNYECYIQERDHKRFTSTFRQKRTRTS